MSRNPPAGGRTICIRSEENFYGKFHPGSSPGQVMAKNNKE